MPLTIQGVINMLRELDKDEHTKYALWSDYASQWESYNETAEHQAKYMTYFEWLDFYELS